MKNCQMYILFAFAIVSCQIIHSGAFEDTKCNGLDIKVAEEHAMHLEECSKVIGTEVKEQSMTQLVCMFKCIMEKKGLVDAKGAPHKENVLKMMDDSMPDLVKQDLKNHFEKCLDEFGPQIQADDESCMSFSPLGLCFHASFLDVCKSSEVAENQKKKNAQ